MLLSQTEFFDQVKDDQQARLWHFQGSKSIPVNGTSNQAAEHLQSILQMLLFDYTVYLRNQVLLMYKNTHAVSVIFD